MNATNTNFCICETGWSNDLCDQCVPYWECPNKDESTACIKPNECLCPDGTEDPKGLCQCPNGFERDAEGLCNKKE